MSSPEITPVQAELATTPTDVAIPETRHGRHWIDDWRPEDPVFWEETGRADRQEEPDLLGGLRAHRLLGLVACGR